MVEAIPLREDVPKELTWDLTTIFPTDEAWEEEFEKLENDLNHLTKYKGHLLDNADTLYEAIAEMLDLSRRVEKVYVYASLNSDQDTANQKYVGYDAMVQSLASKAASMMSYFEPELLSVSDEKIQELISQKDELKELAHYFDTLKTRRAHTLSPKEEELVAKAGDALATADRTFGMLSNADMDLGTVTDEDGNTIKLSNGLYSQFLESDNRTLRQDAFNSMYTAYGKLKNTFAATLSGKIKVDNYLADVHNYQNAREAAVSRNHIPEQVFDTLVETVNKNIGLLHKFVTLRKKVLGVSEVHSYDLYTPLVKEVDFEVTYEKAQEIVLEALKPLGQDYLDIVKKAFAERWIDVVENEGKRSGAYSGGAYDTNPYILLNWQDTLDNVYTLIHELGHTVHSYYTRKNQPYHYGDYPIFLAEIASTTNEMLLTEYFLNNTDDDKFKAYILNQNLDGFKGTIYRQTQFAEFEHWMHQQDANGVPLTAETLSAYYGDLNQNYYGKDLTFDEQIALEWSRIPHFYYNYYVYQYATGLAAAITLSEAIKNEGQTAVDKYKDYLKAGSSDYALNVIQKAGVDMQKPDYLNKAFAVFEERLNELDNLLK